MLEFPLHIVAVTAFVQNNDGEILLVKSPKRGWELPGGQVEPGEDLITAIRRELSEEASIEVEPDRLIGVYSNVGSHDDVPTKLIFLFRATFIQGKLTAQNEILEAGWVAQSKACNLVSEESNSMRLKDGLLRESTKYRIYETNPFKIIASREL